MGGTPVNIEGGIPRQGSFNFMKRVPEEGDKKAAMDMLYGGFMDEPEEKMKSRKNNLVINVWKNLLMINGVNSLE